MRKALVFAFVAGGSLAGYWAYLYSQNPDSPPTVSDVIEGLKSLVARGWIVASTGASEAVGAANYRDIAVSFLVQHEGFSSRVYNDNGKQAIGYGHDLVPGDGFNSSSVISESDARAQLNSDLDTRDFCITNSVQVSLTDNQRAALLSFVYNVGCGAFQSSTMLAKINSGDFEGASQEFSRWIYSTDPATGGKVVNAVLQARRVDEQGLFTS